MLMASWTLLASRRASASASMMAQTERAALPESSVLLTELASLQGETSVRLSFCIAKFHGIPVLTWQEYTFAFSWDSITMMGVVSSRQLCTIGCHSGYVPDKMRTKDVYIVQNRDAALQHGC